MTSSLSHVMRRRTANTLLSQHSGQQLHRACPVASGWPTASFRSSVGPFAVGNNHAGTSQPCESKSIDCWASYPRCTRPNTTSESVPSEAVGHEGESDGRLEDSRHAYLERPRIAMTTTFDSKQPCRPTYACASFPSHRPTVRSRSNIEQTALCQSIALPTLPLPTALLLLQNHRAPPCPYKRPYLLSP